MESESWRRESCSYLADELLEEILSRLPVKSIVRFKCVRKSWYSLFENPSFIAKHHRLRCCSQTNPSLLIESNDSIDDYIIVMSLLHPPYNEVRMLDMNIRFNNTNGGFSMRLLLPNMRGCINGIICIGGSFGDSFNGFFLWNPAIRQYKVVPYPALPPCALTFYTHLFYTDVSYAFGYDNNSNDYKVVRIVTYKRHADHTMVENTFVHVYTLSTDSWRQIINPKFDCLNIIYKNNFDEKYLNGFYYLHGTIKDRDYEAIIGFDMSREVFRIIRMPPYYNLTLNFAVFNDYHAFIFYDNQRTVFKIRMTPSLGPGGFKSLTKKIDVVPVSGIRKPLGFAKNGELLLLLRQDNQTIVFYDIASQEIIENLSLRDFPKSFVTSQAIPYVESLVSFTGENLSSLRAFPSSKAIVASKFRKVSIFRV